MTDVDKKAAIITGGSRGIGAAPHGVRFQAALAIVLRPMSGQHLQEIEMREFCAARLRGCLASLPSLL